MTRNLHGYRQGVEWPAKGETIDIPDHEAADLVANGYAIAAAEATEEETTDEDTTDTTDADKVTGEGSDADDAEQGDDDTGPTKEDLLATAKELGLKVDGRSSAETIAEAIAAAEANQD